MGEGSVIDNSLNFLNPQTAGVPYTEKRPKNEGK